MIKEDKEYCFYCDGVVTTKGVGDHMPVPQRYGGDDSVPCCLSCHDMKDRIPLEQWSFSWKAAVMRDIPRMSRETRIFLGKAMSICLDASKQLREMP